MAKLTSRELVSTLIELELDRKFLEQTQGDDPGFVEEIKPIDEAIIKIKKEMTNKVSGLDHMILEMSKRKDLIDAEIGSLMKEVTRLRRRKDAIKRTEDYFNKNLLPMIIETAGNDGIL